METHRRFLVHIQKRTTYNGTGKPVLVSSIDCCSKLIHLLFMIFVVDVIYDHIDSYVFDYHPGTLLQSCRSCLA